MRTQVRDFLIKPMLALAIAVPAMMAGNVSFAEAGSKHRRAAIIAGAIIGGAIIYNHHKRKKYQRRHSYGHGYNRSGYRYSNNRYGYNRYGTRRHKVYRRHNGYHRHNRGNHGYYSYRQRWGGR